MNYKTNNSSILIKKIKNFLNSINENKSIPLICKYLTYFSLFDILGKYTFPNENSYCEKYKKLINHYSSWKYKTHISSLQLKCMLTHINRDLRPFIEAKINKNPLTDNNFFSEIVPADEVDFAEEKLKEGLNSFQLELYEKNIGAIHQARYDNLFYRLRCFVVHELRLPTPNALNLDENSEMPMYVIFNDGYRLWFSPKVILLILEECIEKTNGKINYDYNDIFKPIPKCWIGKRI
ncbi:MAG: hypothetical protein KAW56_03735 [Candidatus Marinimicrobia bacterium]|nr:hypothetical protein [Candidatus Neomarinimicrobiota bacterium]